MWTTSPTPEGRLTTRLRRRRLGIKRDPRSANLSSKPSIGFGKNGYKYTSTITYTYDAGNRITKIADSRGGNITRTFDNLDRLTKVNRPGFGRDLQPLIPAS